MISPFSHNNSNKLSIYLKTESDTEVRSRHNQIYEEKLLYLNQLENFYMPFMKQIYNANKQKLQGTVKSPQQLIKAIKGVQSKQSELKRRYQPYKRDNQYKDAKIKQLTAKVIHLSNQLKNIKPDEQINLKIKRDSNEQQKLKRMGDLMKIKNEQSVFRIKVKVINLLEEFEINKKQIDEISKLESEYEIFESMITKLKNKYKLIRNKQKNSIQQIKRQKFQLEAYQQKIKFLEQSNEILRNNQKKNRQKIQQIKKQWKTVCDRLVIRDKEYQIKQNQLYQLKKILDQKQTLLIKSTVNQKNNLNQQQNSKKQIQTQIKQLRNQINNYILELNQLRTLNEQKQSTIEQCKIKQIFLQEECERMNRQYIRWKERYQTIVQVQQSNSKNYLKQIQELKEKINNFENKDTNLNKLIQENKQQIQNYQRKIKLITDQNKNLQQRVNSLQKLKSQNKQKQEKYLKEKQDLSKVNALKQKQILQLKSMINDINQSNQQNEYNFSKKLSELQSSLNCQMEIEISKRQIQYQNKLNEINLNWELLQKKLKQQYQQDIFNLKQSSFKLQSQLHQKSEQKTHIDLIINQYENAKKQFQKLVTQLNQVKIELESKSIKINQLEERIQNQSINYQQNIQRLQTKLRQQYSQSQKYKFQITKLEDELNKKNNVCEIKQQQIYKSKTIIQTKIDQQAKLNQQIKKLKEALKDKGGQKPYSQTIYHTSNLIKVGQVSNRKVEIIRLKDLKK